MTCMTASIFVLDNDTDPEGNTPLSVLSVTQGTKGSSSVRGAGAYVRYTAGNLTGADPLTYTVKDSLGATSTGTINITVTPGQC